MKTNRYDPPARRTIPDHERRNNDPAQPWWRALVGGNVASACGATPQYAGLQELHEKHDDLTVVGFPCNQFGAQEPGTHDEICEFTSSKYSVSFPLMAKIDVNGSDRLPLFERLCQNAVAGAKQVMCAGILRSSSLMATATLNASQPGTTRCLGSLITVFCIAVL